MYKLIFYLFSIFFVIINTSFSQVVYIDINKVLNESSAGKQAIKSLESEIKSKNINFTDTEKKLFNEEKNIIAKKNILSEQDYNNEVIKFRKKLNDYKVNKSNELKKLNEKKISVQNKFMEQINPIIADYASNNNISIVIRKEHMIIGKTELDISDNILKIVNQKIKEID